MLKRRAPSRTDGGGFTLVELVVALAMLGILLGLAAPSFSLWTRNARVRGVTDSLINGVRLAQSEAVRRNRQVVFFLTGSADCTASTNSGATAGGSAWAVRTVALTTGDVVEAVQCGALAEQTAGVVVAGPTALCFNSMGRQTANADPGLGGTACTLDSSGVSTFNISSLSSDRPLRLLVGLNGQVRQCDPARSLSATATDGCP